MQGMIKNIIEYSINAPSGDNSQPWRFVVKNNEIHLFNLPKRDLTLYNFKRRGDYIAHGALIENIVLTASQYGFKTKIDLFPQNENIDFVARLTFEKNISQNSVLQNSPLYKAIKNRTTNRKPYKTEFLLEEQKHEIYKSADEIDNIEIKLTEDKDKVKDLSGIMSLIEEKGKIGVLAKAVSLNDRLMLENFYIHRFLFSIIRWSEEEEKEKAGMYFKTLELSPPQLFIFKHIFSRWSLLQILNKLLGISKLLPKETSKLYSSSSAIGIVAIKSEANENFVYVGRLFEKIWLKAVTMNLAFKPLQLCLI